MRPELGGVSVPLGRLISGGDSSRGCTQIHATSPASRQESPLSEAWSSHTEIDRSLLSAGCG